MKHIEFLKKMSKSLDPTVHGAAGGVDRQGWIWAMDAVHPTAHTFAKMALNLLE
jgi:hypothetical protein